MFLPFYIIQKCSIYQEVITDTYEEYSFYTTLNLEINCTLTFSFFQICICARLCQSLVMSAYTYLQHPENLYLLTTADAGWELLTKLRSQTEQETIKTWQSIMEKYS